jgi:hypothetical protein
MTRVLMAVLVVSTAVSCAGHLRAIGIGLDQVRELVQQIDCRDGAPARILIDVHCLDGICGVTCAPDRWKP